MLDDLLYVTVDVDHALLLVHGSFGALQIIRKLAYLEGPVRLACACHKLAVCSVIADLAEGDAVIGVVFVGLGILEELKDRPVLLCERLGTLVKEDAMGKEVILEDVQAGRRDAEDFEACIISHRNESFALALI